MSLNPAKIIFFEEDISLWPSEAERQILAHEKMSMADALQFNLKDSFQHVIYKKSPKFDNELRLAQSIRSNPCDFMNYPVAGFLGTGSKEENQEISSCLFYEKVQSRSEVLPLLGRLDQALKQVTRQSSLITQIVSVADELISNAIYNAPFVTPENFVSGIDRNIKNISIEPDRQPTIFVCQNQKEIFLGCTDHYGNLNVRELLNRIHDCYVNGVSNMISCESGGARIGSFLIFNSCSSFFVGVEKGKKTFVGGSFYLGLSESARQDLGTNLHVIMT